MEREILGPPFAPVPTAVSGGGPRGHGFLFRAHPFRMCTHSASLLCVCACVGVRWKEMKQQLCYSSQGTSLICAQPVITRRAGTVFALTPQCAWHMVGTQ